MIMAQGQRRSFGSIECVRHGVYRVRWMADERDGRGYARHSMTRPWTRREATRFLSERQVAHWDDTPTMTVSEVAERFWVPELEGRLREGSLKPKSYEHYMGVYRTHVEPRWGDVSVTGITPLEYQEWILTKSKAMGERVQIVMREILRLARLYGLVEENVAASKFRTSERVDERSKEIWPLSECADMADALRGSVLEVPFVMQAFGSCRVGEACGLKPGDFEFRDVNGMTVACAHVTRQLLGGRGRRIGPPKTKASTRWVVVPEPWSLWLRGRVSEVEASGSEWLCDDGLGGIVGRNTIDSAWRRAFSDGGALAGHDEAPMRNLRASWRTNMRSEMHMDRDLLEKMMGHAGKGVGEVNYFRPDVDVFAEAIACAFRGWERR